MLLRAYQPKGEHSDDDGEGRGRQKHERGREGKQPGENRRAKGNAKKAHSSIKGSDDSPFCFADRRGNERVETRQGQACANSAEHKQAKQQHGVKQKGGHAQSDR